LIQQVVGAIISVSIFDYPEVVELLLKDKRIDPSAENNEALILAVANHNYKVVKLLIQDKRV